LERHLVEPLLRAISPERKVTMRSRLKEALLSASSIR
jgi:hypothetical protein